MLDKMGKVKKLTHIFCDSRFEVGISWEEGFGFEEKTSG